MIKIEHRLYEINPGLSQQERTLTQAGCLDFSHPKENPSKKSLKALAKTLTYLLFGGFSEYIDEAFSVERWSVVFRNHRVLIRYGIFFPDVLFEDERQHLENV